MTPNPHDLRVALPRLHLVLVLVCLSGCADGQPIGRLVHEDGVRPPADRAALQERGASILGALDPAGVLRFIDLDTGLELAALQVDDRGGPVDASAWHERGLSHVALLPRDEEEQEGSLSLHRFQDPFFLRPEAVGLYSGATRTLAVPQGAIVFQEDLGQRWKLAAWSGAFLPSASCSLPRSILGIETIGDDTVIRALAYAPGEGASLLHVTLDQAGFVDCDRALLHVLGGAGESIRAVELAQFGALALVDSHDGRVAVGALQPGQPSMLEESSVPALRIEHVVPWRRGARGGLVVLGSEPASLIALELEAASSRLEIIAEARAPLHGSVTSARDFFSRDLVEVSGLFFVATSTGLEAFEIVLENEVLALDAVSLEPWYQDLEGPLLALPAIGAAD